MNWKNKLKKEWKPFELEDDVRSRREDKAASYDKPPKKQRAGLGGRDKCKIETCYAVSCKYNKDKDCSLPTVTLDKKARCQDFSPENEDLYTKE